MLLLRDAITRSSNSKFSTMLCRFHPLMCSMTIFVVSCFLKLSMYWMTPGTFLTAFMVLISSVRYLLESAFSVVTRLIAHLSDVILFFARYTFPQPPCPICLRRRYSSRANLVAGEVTFCIGVDIIIVIIRVIIFLLNQILRVSIYTSTTYYVALSSDMVANVDAFNVDRISFGRQITVVH